MMMNGQTDGVQASSRCLRYVVGRCLRYVVGRCLRYVVGRCLLPTQIFVLRSQ